jgi:hypothetical protein
MNRIDELLNRYIDSELQEGELEEVQLLLKEDDNVKKLKALRVVDTSLRTFEIDTAPNNFTYIFMNSLSKHSSKIKLSKNYFASTLNLTFVVLILAILVFVFSQINLIYSTTGLDSKVTYTVNMINKSLLPFLSFFKNKDVMFFSSSICLILLLGAYYFVEGHKEFKRRIENLSSK